MKKPRAKTVQSLHKQFKTCIAHIAKERDRIRDLISDMEQIENDCTEALDDFDHGADALSKYL